MADAALAREFVMFCFKRRPVRWPLLYDEMCYVAAKRLFRGMGYDELREAGMDFSLPGLAQTARLAHEVTSVHRVSERPALAT